MQAVHFRCSSLGKIMGDARSIDDDLRTPEVEAIIDRTKRSPEEKALIARLKAMSLSEAARTHVRELVTAEVFGIDVPGAEARVLAKGKAVEGDILDMINRVCGVSIVKNTERFTNEWITGEPDAIDVPRDEGHDAKAAWSIMTFPICRDDVEAMSTFNNYVWQMRGYMMLTGLSRWHIQHGLVDTPEELIGYEPKVLHEVSHVPEHLRLTTYTIERDLACEELIKLKVERARLYYEQVVAEFDAVHRPNRFAARSSPPAPLDQAPAPKFAPVTGGTALLADPFMAEA